MAQPTFQLGDQVLVLQALVVQKVLHAETMGFLLKCKFFQGAIHC